MHHGCTEFPDLFTTVLFECFFLYAVSHGANTLRADITGGHTDSALSTGSHPVTLGSQSSPYATPVSTKTELRATRDHHVVDVHQQNTVVPPPQQAHARNEKPSKLTYYPLHLMHIYTMRLQPAVCCGISFNRRL